MRGLRGEVKVAVAGLAVEWGVGLTSSISSLYDAADMRLRRPRASSVRRQPTPHSIPREVARRKLGGNVPRAVQPARGRSCGAVRVVGARWHRFGDALGAGARAVRAAHEVVPKPAGLRSGHAAIQTTHLRIKAKRRRAWHEAWRQAMAASPARSRRTSQGADRGGGRLPERARRRGSRPPRATRARGAARRGEARELAGGLNPGLAIGALQRAARREVGAAALATRTPEAAAAAAATAYAGAAGIGRAGERGRRHARRRGRGWVAAWSARAGPRRMSACVRPWFPTACVTCFFAVQFEVRSRVPSFNCRPEAEAAVGRLPWLWVAVSASSSMYSMLSSTSPSSKPEPGLARGDCLYMLCPALLPDSLRRLCGAARRAVPGRVLGEWCAL